MIFPRHFTPAKKLVWGYFAVTCVCILMGSGRVDTISAVLFAVAGMLTLPLSLPVMAATNMILHVYGNGILIMQSFFFVFAIINALLLYRLAR